MSNADIEIRNRELVKEIVVAFVSNNKVSPEELGKLIEVTHNTLTGLLTEKAKVEPFVPIKKSVTDEYIICLEDGKKLKMLKRHLRSQYDLSPDEYRERWGLSASYPMVAPGYAKRRAEIALLTGLGRGRKKKEKQPVEP